MDLWLMGLLHCLGNFYTVPPEPAPHADDTACIYVCPMLESIFKDHVFKLAVAATEFEKQHNPTPMTQLHKRLYKKKMDELLTQTKPQLLEVYAHDNVKRALQQVCQHQAEATALEERVAAWHGFVGSMYDVQRLVRKTKLSHVWFPQCKEEADPLRFMEHNQEISLSEEDEQHLVADKLLDLLPFAMIEQYDKEAFNIFLNAR